MVVWTGVSDIFSYVLPMEMRTSPLRQGHATGPVKKTVGCCWPGYVGRTWSVKA
jgi:hypothetical protein